MFSPRIKIMFYAFVILILSPSISFAAGYVRQIIVHGNQKTEKQAIVNIMDVEKNEFVNTTRLKKIKENLVSCGLFRKVRVRARRAGKNRLDIIVNVTEKASMFVFPIFRAWSKRYSGGLIFGESNLFGSNKKTLLVGEGGNKLNQFYGAYEDTSFFNSDFTVRLETIVRWDKTPLYEGYNKIDEVAVKDVGVMITPGYKWTDTISTRFSIDLRYIWLGNSPVIPIDDTNGLNFSFRFEFIWDSLNRNEALVKGSRLKIDFEFADSRLGSDYEYNKGQFEFRHALQFLKHFNWLVNFEAKLGRDLPFVEHYTLGGINLRGFNERQFRGDTLLRLVNEVTFPVVSLKHFGLRGMVFYDMGFVYFDDLGMNRNDFNNGLGAGLRIYMKRIVMPLLGLDFGYGLDNKNFGVYFSIGLMK